MIRQVPSSLDVLVLRGEFSGFTPNTLFAYWTEPDLLNLWWSELAKVEPTIGGRYDLYWPERLWHLYGSYMEFVPGKKLTFTGKWEHEEDELPFKTVTVEFGSREGKGTILTLTHGLYGESSREQQERQGYVVIWQHYLSRLRELTGN